jgi:chemotaxis protein histidine kinase CheA/ActR/RegA family two-component response regulator
VAGDHDDLLPLFLAEAAERLQRLDDAVGRLPDDAAAVASARRELHALKGATRMMGFGELASLCHRCEEAMSTASPLDLVEVHELVDQLRHGLTELADRGGARGVATEPATAVRDGVSREAAGVWMSTGVLDGLSDRATRGRLLTVSAAGIVDRLFELAGLAERGISEPIPTQVLATLAASLRHLGLELETGQRRLRRLCEGQLDSLIALQVQPIEPYLQGLARHATELAASMDKRVEVEVVAPGVRLDRRILGTLRESFLHLVRNAVDHGIETVAERGAAGKPEVASIVLTAEAEGERVRIAVVDDGRGIDPDDVRRRAREVGLDVTDVDDEGVVQLLLRPGFTTRSEATEISGRGIGLDAVSEAVRGVGGDMSVTSTPGEGTAIRIELPIAKRSESATMVRAGRHVVAVATGSVRAYRRIQDDDLRGTAARVTVTPTVGEPVSAWVLRRAFGDFRPAGGVLLEMHARGRTMALVVDEVVGEEEVLIRPIPDVCGVRGLYEGMALTATGLPVPMLAIDATEAEGQVLESLPGGHATAQTAPVRVLLVDDSAVTRAMVRRILEDAGFEVSVASGGEEAWRRLRDQQFDCLVTDIEMPDVDGLELTRRVRASSGLDELPVVVVSTRSRPRDRMEGLEAGADAYLTKQALDARELVDLVRRAGAGR